MSIRIISFCIAVIACCTMPLRAAAPVVATPDKIDAIIKSSVAWLYGQQTEFGNWEKSQQQGENDSQWGGTTALVTYALLAAGEKPLDARIVKATDWLRTAPITGRYAIGLRANVWLHLPLTEPNKNAMLKDARFLFGTVGKEGDAKGFFNYDKTATYVDLSCSQYGVLGAWAGAQRTNVFTRDWWQTIENAWHGQQCNDGGWIYEGKDQPNEHTTIQMAAAGVATLFITQEFVHGEDGIEGTKGNINDPFINKGLDYITKAYPELLEKPLLYAMYGIERVGVASGYKYFGNIDWYQSGASALLRVQNQGRWEGPHDTAFAILFLSRGRAPVMMNKLAYNITAPNGKTREANWNQRPRDVANATRWAAEKTERTLNWQIINLNVADIHDLHDSGLLYITGNQGFAFTDKEKAMLKQYIEEGGIIIGNADVGKSEFTRGFRELARDFFPEYEFKKLTETPDHPLMSNEQFKSTTWKKKPTIEALGNDARLFMILIPSDDASRTLQKRDASRSEIFEFFANAFLYSTDKTQARYKGQTHVVRADPAITPTATVTVARLKYSGRWDPEPGGWKRLSAVMNNEDKTKLETKVVELGKDSLEGIKIAHLTGTRKFALTDAQRTALKEFVAGGGLLVVDSCGGGAEFDASMQEELAKIFPAEAAQLSTPLKPEHALYASDGAPKAEPKYRVFASERLGAEARKFRVKGIEVNGKLGVIYSGDDLSVGLVGMPIDGIVGLEPDQATALVRRILLLRTAGKI
jgi:hypothetical protein